jgi:hypothetical protein
MSPEFSSPVPPAVNEFNESIHLELDKGRVLDRS